MNFNLKHKGFENDLVKREGVNDGIQYVFRFKNGYGASVIKSPYSFGSREDLWELAVLKFNNDGSYDLDYTTEITCDVEGYLTDGVVQKLLKKIKKL